MGTSHRGSQLDSQSTAGQTPRYATFNSTKALICGYPEDDVSALAKAIEQEGGKVLKKYYKGSRPDVIVCGTVADRHCKVSRVAGAAGSCQRWSVAPAVTAMDILQGTSHVQMSLQMFAQSAAMCCTQLLPAGSTESLAGCCSCRHKRLGCSMRQAEGTGTELSCRPSQHSQPAGLQVVGCADMCVLVPMCWQCPACSRGLLAHPPTGRIIMHTCHICRSALALTSWQLLWGWRSASPTFQQRSGVSCRKWWSRPAAPTLLSCSRAAPLTSCARMELGRSTGACLQVQHDDVAVIKQLPMLGCVL